MALLTDCDPTATRLLTELRSIADANAASAAERDRTPPERTADEVTVSERRGVEPYTYGEVIEDAKA